MLLLKRDNGTNHEVTGYESEKYASQIKVVRPPQITITRAARNSVLGVPSECVLHYSHPSLWIAIFVSPSLERAQMDVDVYRCSKL